jgi:hypothetical protein
MNQASCVCPAHHLLPGARLWCLQLLACRHVTPSGCLAAMLCCVVLHSSCVTALSVWLCGRCAVLCCAVLCCAVLCCAVLCCAVLCCAVLCCAVLWCGAPVGCSCWDVVMSCGTVRLPGCNAVLCCVVLCRHAGGLRGHAQPRRYAAGGLGWIHHRCGQGRGLGSSSWFGQQHDPMIRTSMSNFFGHAA